MRKRLSPWLVAGSPVAEALECNAFREIAGLITSWNLLMSDSFYACAQVSAGNVMWLSVAIRASASRTLPTTSGAGTARSIGWAAARRMQFVSVVNHSAGFSPPCVA